MARGSQQLREQLGEEIGAPLDFQRVREVFGSSSAAADALGLRSPARNADDATKAAMRRRRRTFQESWRKWSQGLRRPTAGYWERLRTQGERAEIVRQVRLYGLKVVSWTGEVDVYGSDIRERDIDEVTRIDPEELEPPVNPWDFYTSVGRNDWTEAAKAVATAWFSNYIGNDLDGGDAAWGEGELEIRIPRPGRETR